MHSTLLQLLPAQPHCPPLRPRKSTSLHSLALGAFLAGLEAAGLSPYLARTTLATALLVVDPNLPPRSRAPGRPGRERGGEACEVERLLLME